MIIVAGLKFHYSLLMLLEGKNSDGSNVDFGRGFRFKVGGSWRFKREDIERWITQKKSEAGNK